MESVTAGDARREEEIFWKHPVADCVNCHALGGKGITVGPALDAIANWKGAAYLLESPTDPTTATDSAYQPAVITMKMVNMRVDACDFFPKMAN